MKLMEQQDGSPWDHLEYNHLNLTKPFFAIICAWLLTLWRDGEEFPGWIWATAIVCCLVFILVLQPDIGMTSVIVLTWGFQMFLAECQCYLFY